MRVKHLAAGILAVAGLALATPAFGGDTIRLNLADYNNASVKPLVATDADLDADTLEVWRGGGFRGGFHGGGFRGGFGGFRGGFGGFRGGFVGHRGFIGFNRGFVGFNRGFVGFRPFAPRFFGFYPRFGGGFSRGCAFPASFGFGYGYYPGWSSCGVYASPCSVSVGIPPITRVLGTVPPGQVVPAPLAPLPPGNGTYQYDGGPANPVPMPPPEETPTRSDPRRPAVYDEVMVSLPGEQSGTGKWVYPAYGEAPRREGKSSLTGVMLIPIGTPAH
jgi:hypothetical protein